MADREAPFSPPAPTGPANAAAANVAPPPLQGPHGSAAQDALLQKRLDKLRQQLQAEMNFEEDDDDDDELRPLRIEAAMERARDRIPAYKDAKAAYQAIERQAREILQGVTETLSTEDPVKTVFATAQVALKRWNSTVRPQLEAAAASANACWFRPTVRDPLQGKTSMLLAEFDAAEARLTTIAASVFPVVSGASSSSGDHKKDAFQFDAAAYIGAHAFSGDGNPKQVLEGYRQWQGKWDAAVKYMRAHYTDVDPSVLLSKLQDTLSGKALDLALTVPPNTAGGYESALKKLQGRYDDSVALAAAYLAPLDRPDSSTTYLERHELAENAREQLRILHPILEEEQMDLLDFMVLRPVFAAMPSSQRADWDAFVLDLKAAHSKESAGVPWRQGMALNSDTFFAWSKGFATRHKDEVPQEETSVFHATDPKRSPSSGEHQKCVIHGASSLHATSVCPDVASMTTEKWRKACRDIHHCGYCAFPYKAGHYLTCKVTCSLCQGHHLDLRCGKDPARPPPRARGSEDARKPAAKRPRSELDAASLATTVAKSVAAAFSRRSLPRPLQALLCLQPLHLQQASHLASSSSKREEERAGSL